STPGPSGRQCRANARTRLSRPRASASWPPQPSTVDLRMQTVRPQEQCMRRVPVRQGRGEAPALPIEDAVRLLLVAGGTEAVRPIPVPQPGRRIERDDGAGLEPCEPPGPARERDEAGTAREVERDVAGRGVVAVPRVEDDVAV